MRTISHLDGSTEFKIIVHDDLSRRIRLAARREGMPAEELIVSAVYSYLADSEAAFLDHKYADHFRPSAKS